jgi:mRNA interferase MazF
MDFEYDNWNTVKKRIENSDHIAPYYKDGDIWWISIGYNIGCEIYGKGKDYARPVLVLKRFNQESFIGVPLSSKYHRSRYYIPIIVKNKKVFALISQIRLFSTKRMIYKHTELDVKDYRRVLDNVFDILELPPSITRGSRD